MTCILWYVYTTLLLFCCYSDLEIALSIISICHTSRIIELTSRNGIGNGSRIHVDVHAHVQLAGYYLRCAVFRFLIFCWNQGRYWVPFFDESERDKQEAHPLASQVL